MRASRILVVDDEEPVKAALCKTLEDHGHQAEGCLSGAEALEFLRHSQYDLLLTDLVMPEMDGITLMRLAQKIDPHLVCIMVAEASALVSAVESLEVGATDYVLKPFNLNVMRPVISRALTIRWLRRDNVRLEQQTRNYLAQLEGANSELESFCYSVSHDLRAPLRHISGYAEMLANDSPVVQSVTTNRYLEKIQTSARTMDQLIEGLLRLSRLSRQSVSRRPVNVSALVGDLASELAKNCRDRKVDFQLGRLPDCVGDPMLLREAFGNLLSNAVKFTRPRDPAMIQVGCQLNESENVYFVKDNGVGFDPRYSDKLFGVFRKLHSVEEFEGVGVGLSIVKTIVHRHGGRIWTDAELNNGARFYFTLPAETATRA